MCLSITSIAIRYFSAGGGVPNVSSHLSIHAIKLFNYLSCGNNVIIDAAVEESTFDLFIACITIFCIAEIFIVSPPTQKSYIIFKAWVMVSF